MSDVKPQLHSSHLSMLSHCGHKFQRIVLEGEREPPTTPLIIGTSSHVVNALNLTNKIEKGTLLTKEAVQDFARDEFLKQWGSSPLVLSNEEAAEGVKKTRDHCQDATIQVCTEYHYSIAPKLRPVSVEEKWVLQAKGLPYDLSGTWDVREKYDFDITKGIFLPKEIMNIRDTKTRGRDLGQGEVDRSEQYTIYAMAMYYIYGVIPDNIYQDTLIKPTNTQPARAKIYASTRTNDDFIVFQNRFETACTVIEKEAFTPSNPNHFLCSKDFCGFAAAGTCKYFNSKRGPAVTKTIVDKTQNNQTTGGSNNARRETERTSLIESLTNSVKADKA